MFHILQEVGSVLTGSGLGTYMLEHFFVMTHRSLENISELGESHNWHMLLSHLSIEKKLFTHL